MGLTKTIFRRGRRWRRIRFIFAALRDVREAIGLANAPLDAGARL
jgi:hypothetical protein